MKRTSALVPLAFACTLLLDGLVVAQAPEKPATAPAGQTGSEPGRAEVARIDPAEWVPADALFYAGITDVPGTWAEFKKTAPYRLMSDPETADAAPDVAATGAVVRKVQERIAAALGVDREQLRNPFGGPLAFYLHAPAGGGSDDVQPGLVAAVGDAALLRKYYDAAVTKLKGITRHEAQTAGDVTIDVFRTEPKGDATGGESASDEEFAELDEEDALAGPLEQAVSTMVDELFSAEALPESLAACLTTERLIVAGTPEQVRALLRQEKGARSLADTDDHKALLRHLKPVGPVRALVNMPRLFEVLRAESRKADGEGGDAQAELNRWLTTLGAESMRGLVAHVRIGGKFESKAEALLLAGGERSGLVRLLSLENRPVAPPETIPADACLYGGLNVAPPKLMEEIERLVRQADAEAADALRAGLEATPLDGAEPVNLRRELLEHLTGPITLLLRVTTPVGSESTRTLLSIGHRDQAALVRFLAARALLQERELRGTRVFDLRPAPGHALAVTTDRLLAGTTAAVEASLDNTSDGGLAEAEAWQRAAREVPEEAWLVVWMDKRRALSAALDLARQREEPAGLMPDVGRMLLSLLLKGATDNLENEAQIRQVRVLLKYTGQSLMTVATTPEGLRFTQVDLAPRDTERGEKGAP